MRGIRDWGLLLAALCAGLLIGFVDTRPNWDDTGITVFALLATTALFGAIRPAKTWLWALAIGIWLPVLNIVLAGNYQSIAALAFAFIGAYAGAFARRLLNGLGRAT